MARVLMYKGEIKLIRNQGMGRRSKYGNCDALSSVPSIHSLFLFSVLSLKQNKTAGRGGARL